MRRRRQERQRGAACRCRPGIVTAPHRGRLIEKPVAVAWTRAGGRRTAWGENASASFGRRVRDAELVPTAHPGRDLAVVRAHASAGGFPGWESGRVAGAVPVGVVVGLEAVEIETGQEDLRRKSRHPSEGALSRSGPQACAGCPGPVSASVRRFRSDCRRSSWAVLRRAMLCAHQDDRQRACAGRGSTPPDDLFSRSRGPTKHAEARFSPKKKQKSTGR